MVKHIDMRMNIGNKENLRTRETGNLFTRFQLRLKMKGELEVLAYS